MTVATETGSGARVPGADLPTPVLERRNENKLTIPGMALVGLAFISALVSFAILLGVTPIEPVESVVMTAIVINLVFVLGMLALVILEIRALLRARTRGKAAARLHIRIVALFSIVAILPAILVAIVASITLDVGLDRWFSLRTKSIVNSSLSVAEAYVLENARFLQGQTVSMANDLDNARSLYSLDRTGFINFLTRQAVGRGLLGAFFVRADGSVILQADIKTERPLPAIPPAALQDAVNGKPTLIPPGVTNLVGAIMPMQQIDGTFLYTVRAVDSVSCDPPNLSGHSGALYGVLRDRVGPDKPGGQITRCFCQALIDNDLTAINSVFSNLTDNTFYILHGT